MASSTVDVLSTPPLRSGSFTCGFSCNLLRAEEKSKKSSTPAGSWRIASLVMREAGSSNAPDRSRTSGAKSSRSKSSVTSLPPLATATGGALFPRAVDARVAAPDRSPAGAEAAEVEGAVPPANSSCSAPSDFRMRESSFFTCRFVRVPTRLASHSKSASVSNSASHILDMHEGTLAIQGALS